MWKEGEKGSQICPELFLEVKCSRSRRGVERQARQAWVLLREAGCLQDEHFLEWVGLPFMITMLKDFKIKDNFSQHVSCLKFHILNAKSKKGVFWWGYIRVTLIYKMFTRWALPWMSACLSRWCPKLQNGRQKNWRQLLKTSYIY